MAYALFPCKNFTFFFCSPSPGEHYSYRAWLDQTQSLLASFHSLDKSSFSWKPQGLAVESQLRWQIAAMKLLLSYLLLVATGLVVNAKLWTDCSKCLFVCLNAQCTLHMNDAGSADDKTRATIQSITVNPETPKKGEDLTIMATFTLSKLKAV